MKEDFSRAAATYDAAAVLARETQRRLAERLSYTKVTPQRVADIGCATGDGLRLLQQSYPQAQAIALDFALPMLRAVQARVPLWQRLRRRAPLPVQADVRQLPLADASLDLVWSNLMLHWLADPLPALRELARVMRTGGLLTFTLLGPDTLKEWRAALAKVGGEAGVSRSTAPRQPNGPADGRHSISGAGETAPRRFFDMHDIGDMLVAAGFGDPVMDREDIVLTYRSARPLCADQRHLGVRNAIFGAVPWRQARAALGAWRRDADGRLPVSFEVIYGQAWKAPPRPARGRSDGASVVRFFPPAGRAARAD